MDRIIPLDIVTGQATVYYNKLQASFGEYSQVYEENGRNNTNAQQSLGAIAFSTTPYKAIVPIFIRSR